MRLNMNKTNTAGLFGLAVLGALIGCSGSGLDSSGALVGMDRSGGGQDVASAEGLREQAGYDSLPDEIRSKLDSKIAKKLKGGPTSHGADAIDFFMMQRLPEGEEYPINRVMSIAKSEREKAEAQMAERELSLRNRSASGAGAQPGLGLVIDGWQPLGPGNVGGRTRAMVISPAGPGTGLKDDEGFMLAAGVAGGVFKSTDGGESWRPVSDLLENIAISAMVLDPTDPNIVYVGTGEGFSNGDAVRGLGIFKSTDAGESWRQLEETISPAVVSFAFHYVNKLAISPADPKRIYVAARTGIWLHNNAGEPMNKAGDEFQWELKLANPFFMTGAQRSNGSEAGATDIQVRPAPASGNADPLEDEIVLAAMGGFSSDGLWITNNGGDSWFQVIDEIASEDELFTIDSLAQGRMSIAFGPRANEDSGVVYVLMARNQFFPAAGLPDGALDIPFGSVFNLFRANLTDVSETLDDSDNLIGISLPFEARLALEESDPDLNRLLLSNALVSGVCGGTVSPRFSQGWYDSIVKVDPADEDVVWVGGIDLFRSDDGGQNFGIASYWYFDDAEDPFVHADQHEIVFHPDYDGETNTTMYITNDGGIYRTQDALAMVASSGCPFTPDKNGKFDESEIVFESLNNGYEVTQFYHGATGTSVGGGRDLYVGGTQDNGTNRSLRRECTEGWQNILGGDGGYVAVDPTDNDIIYAETQNFGNIFRITNLPGVGDNVRNINARLGPDNGLFITPFAMDPSDPATIWTGGTRPWRTSNANESNPNFVNWRRGPNFNLPDIPIFFDVVSRVSAIAVAPSNPDIVYMGFEDGYIARTQNGTDTDPDWIVISNGLPVETGFISSIAVDPDDANVAWITNSRFTEFTSDSNVYRGTSNGDANDPAMWLFESKDGTDCDFDDGIDPTLPPLPAHWIAIRRCGSVSCSSGDCLVFVGTEIGVYVSQDAYEIDEDCDPLGDGTQLFDKVTWNNINLGFTGSLPTTVVETLAFRDDNTIVAFTHGRGAFLANILQECDNVSQSEPCNPADIVAPFGTLDAADLLAFTQDFGTMRLSADIPIKGESCGDGILDSADLLRYIELFGEGCP